MAPREIAVVAGDTGPISLGMGAFASRQTVMGGSAVHVAACVVRDKVRKAAAEILEVDADDLELRDGRVEVKGVPKHGLDFGELAIAMAGVPGYKLPGDLPPGLEHSHNHLGNSLTYAGAFMAVELEVGYLFSVKFRLIVQQQTGILTPVPYKDNAGDRVKSAHRQIIYHRF